MKKTNKFTLLIFVVVLIGLLVASLSACDRDKVGTTPNEYESTFYTVTFNTNGGTVSEAFESDDYKNIPYGSTIKEPKYADGTPVRPTKLGYTFKWWSANGTEQFNFDSDKVTGNLTLSAIYFENVYYYSVNLEDTFVIKEDGTVSKGEKHSEKGFDVTLSEAQLDKLTTSIKSTYNLSSSFPVPEVETDNEQENKFCFWYYIDPDTHAPVQFTKMAQENATNVETLEKFTDRKMMNRVLPRDTKDENGESIYKNYNDNEFIIDPKITMYPMFESDLPKITVSYLNEDGTEADFTESADSAFPSNGYATAPTGTLNLDDNEEFSYWYYKALSYDEDGKVLYVSNAPETDGPYTSDKEKAKLVDGTDDEYEYYYKYVKFEFATKDEDGKLETKDATALLDAYNAALENNVNYLKPVTLKLYAKIRTVYTVNGRQDYIDNVYKILHPQSGDPAPTEAEIAKLLDGHIKISADLELESLNDGPWEPLFDKDHVFTGVIDGGTDDGSGNVALHTISGTFGYDKGSDHSNTASVFGYVAGTIKNLKFNEICLKVTVPDVESFNASNAIAYLGVIATVNRGTIENCEVTLGSVTLSDAGLNAATATAEYGTKFTRMIFGGVTALSEGESSDNKATTSLCKVSIESLTIDTDLNVLFGGIVGQSAASTAVADSKVTIEAVNLSADALSFGGIVGYNNGSIDRVNATLNIGSALSKSSFTLGGIAATNRGGIEYSWADLTLIASNNGSDAQVAVGGLIGANDGYALNSYAEVSAELTIKNAGATVEVGGLVGNNYSVFEDGSANATHGVGAINYAYAVGNIKVNVTTGSKNVTTYVGGLAGRHRKAHTSVTKVNNSFASVDVEVQNDAEGSVNNIGYLFGKRGDDGKDDINNAWFNKNVAIKLNGTTYVRTEEGEGKDGNFEVDYVGEAVEGDASFKDKTWLTSEKDEDGKIVGPAFKEDDWDFTEAEENPDYPQIKLNGKDTEKLPGDAQKPAELPEEPAE